MKPIIRLALVALAIFSSCKKTQVQEDIILEYTVASKRGYTIDGESGFPIPLFYIRQGSSDWEAEEMFGFESYEPGYEYVVRAKHVDDWAWRDGEGKDHYVKVLQLQEILSKERKESSGLPDGSNYDDYLANPDDFWRDNDYLYPLNAAYFDISRIHVKTSGNQSSVTYSYAYDSDGRLSSVTYDDGQGDVREYVYTFYDDLLSCVVQGDVRYDYTFDGSRRILRMEKSSGGMIEKTYDYAYEGSFLSMIRCSDGSEWRYSTEEYWEGNGNIVEVASYMDGILKDVCRISPSGTLNNFNVTVPGLSLPCFCDFTADGFLTGRNPSFCLPFEISQDGQTRRFHYERESGHASNDMLRIECDGTVWEFEYNDSYQWL